MSHHFGVTIFDILAWLLGPSVESIKPPWIPEANMLTLKLYHKVASSANFEKFITALASHLIKFFPLLFVFTNGS